MKIGLINLGCPKNIVDLECMLSKISQYSLTTNPLEADYVIINTCAFLKDARKESENSINELLKFKKINKNLKIIIAGCYVSLDKSLINKYEEKVYAFLDTNSIYKITNSLKNSGIYTAKKPYLYSYNEHNVLLNPYVSYVKISEGCNRKCSFCLIPSIKGRYRSRKVNDIVNEVKNLVHAGIKEVNIISQDTTYYGKDLYGKFKLIDLLNNIFKNIKTYFWLRLLYLYPDFNLIKEIVELIKNEKRLCNYVDIPFQHISDSILKRMKRGYRKKDILKIVEYLKRENIVVRSTFIVGFPGETEKDFNELIGFIKMGYIDKIGIFPYSDEKGTVSYNLSEKLAKKVINTRKNILMLESKRISTYNNKNLLYKKIKTLILGENKKFFIGRDKTNAPDIDNYIFIRKNKKIKTGKFFNVKITKYKNNNFYGELYEGKKN